MNKTMMYLIAIVASYAAVQAWKRVAMPKAPGVLGNAPCAECVANPEETKGCCGGH